MKNYSKELIERYAVNVPRYTSYPTAPHFQEMQSPVLYAGWLQNLSENQDVSLYIHIPFCDRLCWFCGCHTKHTLKYDPVREYLKVLYQEIDLVGRTIGAQKVAIKQLHLGGGSPSMLQSSDLIELRKKLQQNFRFADDIEISIELDPSDLDGEDLEGFEAFGMNRASIGVQDFSEIVQKTINRPQSFEDTARVVAGLRKIGINSLNIDALYGLPMQTIAGLQDTLGKVISLEPDRVAMFGYAHVPWMKKHQQMIDEKAIPGLTERFAQARLSEQLLTEAGYLQIGMDHFAKPEDSLAKATAARRLKRNFQGYTTDDNQVLIGLGASSIGRMPQGYMQNIHATANYMREVKEGHLPVSKGLELSVRDKLHGAVIEQLMCYFEIDFFWLEQQRKDAGDMLVDEIYRIGRAIVGVNEDGFFTETSTAFELKEEAHPFVRQFASEFDDYLNRNAAKYSIAV